MPKLPQPVTLATIRAQIAKCGAVIDFSFHEVTAGMARLAAEHQLPLVIGTTGHTQLAQRNPGCSQGRIPVSGLATTQWVSILSTT